MLKCMQCAAYDQATRKQMLALFSIEEIHLLTLNIAGYLKHLAEMIANKETKDLVTKMKVMHERDMLSQTIGKFLVSLEPEHRNRLIKVIHDRLGLSLQVMHEACPHQEQKAQSNE